MSNISRPHQGPTPSIGWVEGNCLAVDREGLKSGTEITVVVLNDPQKVADAEITKLATAASECSALREERSAQNVKVGVAFYVLKSVDPIPVGVGLVAAAGEAKTTNTERLDINRNGQAASFSHCMTSEGIQYNAWSGEPYASEKLWNGYNYLGYDSESTCPTE